MVLTQIQKIFIASFIALLFVMYFGCETKPTKIKSLEKSRELSMEATSIENIIREAKKKLSANQIATIETFAESARKDTINKIQNFELMARQWFDLGVPVISGYYAEEIANIKNTADAWSIAGTSYIYGIKGSQDEKEREFAKSRAIKALEKAISLDPDNVNHKINMALCYVEKPDQDNPMKGILQLRELNTKYPQNTSVLNQLARLALKTNQIDKAIQRLNESLAIDGKNESTICLLAEAYGLSGDKINEAKFAKLCSK